MTDVVALEAQALGRRYGNTWGLRDCTLSVIEGSITGLVGPNGAGKSTLLRLAAGLSRPTTGRVRIFGDEVDPNSTRHLDRIGYFDQLRPLYPSLSAQDTLRLGKKLNAHWDDDAAVQWLTGAGIALDQRVGRLSVGQQALVALALCMGKRPDLLLLDEPLASLDPLARRRLLEILLGTVAERGITVFLSSHIVSELEPICDHLVILSSSSVRIAGPIETLLAEHHLLIGPRSDPPPSGPEVVSVRTAERQTTLLVRGDLPDLGPSWRRLEPDLDEIVLAYLEDQSERTASAGHAGASTEGDAS